MFESSLPNGIFESGETWEFTRRRREQDPDESRSGRRTAPRAARELDPATRCGERERKREQEQREKGKRGNVLGQDQLDVELAPCEAAERAKAAVNARGGAACEGLERVGACGEHALGGDRHRAHREAELGSMQNGSNSTWTSATTPPGPVRRTNVVEIPRLPSVVTLPVRE